MKLTEEQKELISLLPMEVRKSKELNVSAKLVLGDIIYLYGMDKAKENGFVFRTNEEMMIETGIKSEHTLINAVRQLEVCSLIQTKRGKRGQASEYLLLQNEENNAVINCSNNSKSAVINCSNNNEDILLYIKQLENRIAVLEDKIAVISAVINCSNNENTDCSTESDTETEKESETSSSHISNITTGMSLTVTVPNEEKTNNITSSSQSNAYEEYPYDDCGVWDNFIDSYDDEKRLMFDVQHSMEGYSDETDVSGAMPNGSVGDFDNNFLNFFDMKENETSNNGTSAMNAIESSIFEDKVQGFTPNEKENTPLTTPPSNGMEMIAEVYRMLDEMEHIEDAAQIKAYTDKIISILTDARTMVKRSSFERCCNDCVYWCCQNGNLTFGDFFKNVCQFKTDVQRLKVA